MSDTKPFWIDPPGRERWRTKDAWMSTDPTYERSKIDANPEWELAFTLSEIMNDNAPIGWSRYIMQAKCLLATYEMRRKPAALSPSREDDGK